MKDWFANLEARERLFVIGGGAFVVIALIYSLAWMPFDKQHRQLASSVANWERSLADLRPLRSIVAANARGAPRPAVVAQQAPIIVVDQTKCSTQLGTLFPVPVEVLAFALRPTIRHIEDLGAKTAVRTAPDGGRFLSDQGNPILDCSFGPIDDVVQLATALDSMAGVLGQGLFLGLADDVVVASPDGIVHRKRT